jgi:hypothetical protein
LISVNYLVIIVSGLFTPLMFLKNQFNGSYCFN